jgi:hypothetical protein
MIFSIAVLNSSAAITKLIHKSIKIHSDMERLIIQPRATTIIDINK